MTTPLQQVISSLQLFHVAAMPTGQTPDANAVVAAMLAHYNALYPEDAIDMSIPLPRTRRITNQTEHSDRLRKSLESDPSGGSFIALRLPVLQAQLRRTMLPVHPSSAGKLESILEEYMHINALVESGLQVPAYVTLRSAIQRIHDAAAQIKPDVHEDFGLDTLIEEYPYRVADLSKELSAYTPLLLSETAGAAMTRIPDQINDWIIKIGDDRELLAASTQAPFGFTLFATINAADPAASYFSLLCKSPGKTILYQDVLPVQYPGQHTRRRNDRTHERRIERSPFPYELLDLDISDNGRSITMRSDSKALQTSDGMPVRVLASVRDMSAPRLIDLLTCMQLVAADWAELSPQKLAQPEQALLSLNPARTNLPMLVTAEPIHLPWEKLTTHQLTTAQYQSMEIEAGKKGRTSNWVAEQQLPEVLAMMTEESLIQSDSTALIFPAEYGVPAILSTEQRVKADLTYLARVAQAEKVVPRIAAWKSQATIQAREFLKEKMATSPLLKKHLLNPELWGVDGGRYSESRALSLKVDLPDDAAVFYAENSYLLGFGSRFDAASHRKENSIDAATGKLRHYMTTAWLDDKHYAQGFPLTNETVYLNRGTIDPSHSLFPHIPLSDRKCFYSDEPAEFFVEFRLEGNLAVAAFTGVHWQSLPPLLRTMGNDPYLGNSILDRVDPLLDSHHWHSKKAFTVAIGVSMKTLNKLRAEIGLPALSKAAIKRIFAEKRNK
jgi:hypothetical protein